jgi:hypothetical protein
MAAFMDGYEGNKERTDRWIATFPQGRLEAHIIEFNAEKGYVLVQAKAFRNQTEIDPAGIDYAYGYLAAYPDKMKRWMIEDTCTSALMRVMALVMGNTEKATKEVMALVKSETPAADYDYWATKHGDVPSYQTAAEAEQAGTPSFGEPLGSTWQSISNDNPLLPGKVLVLGDSHSSILAQKRLTYLSAATFEKCLFYWNPVGVREAPDPTDADFVILETSLRFVL